MQAMDFKLMCHDDLYLIFCQILTFFYVQTDMELCKRISRYQPVIMRTHHHTFQPHIVEPYRGVLQIMFGCKISSKLLDKVRRKFQHDHIISLIECLDESCDIISCP